MLIATQTVLLLITLIALISIIVLQKRKKTLEELYRIYDKVGGSTVHSVTNFGEVELDDISSHHYSELDHPYDTVSDQITEY